MIQLEKSLKRLKTDYIALYFIHYFESHTSYEYVLGFLDDARRQGQTLRWIEQLFGMADNEKYFCLTHE
ncbi:MAG: aldo/keto reductase [Fibrobacterota bacterium]